MLQRAVVSLGLILQMAFSSLAESVSDHAVRASAVAQTRPPQIILAWPADPNATAYTVCRKLRDDRSWGTGRTLAANATNYIDSNVEIGTAYEYSVSKSASAYGGVGFVYGGIEVPLVQERGKVILIVENTFTSTLALELKRLEQDLVSDGWTVLRHDVPRMSVDPTNPNSNVWLARSNELAAVKSLITADYTSDTNNVRAVLLLGHVPVPYSGRLAPDAHSDHLGAWPADIYYGEMSSNWTDSSWTSTTASDTRNWNFIGDGKFDQSVLPGNVSLEVGRVDFANMPVFALAEADLLRRYLNKNHSFRHRKASAERRGLISDGLGILGGELPAINGWRNFAPFFGADKSFATSSWLSTLATNTYLWGSACGGGSYTSCGGVGSSADLAASDPGVVFQILFGSYFGDWDSQNNFLRAAIATTNFTLASVWASRPHWHFHHMALGETIGFSTRLTQNNDGSLYPVNVAARSVHIALMGDPTLRMHPVSPPSALLIKTNALGGVRLSWNPSPEAVLGYNVYRAPTSAGPFTRLNTSLITDAAFSDSGITTNVYMIRAVKLEVSASGSYYNASQGIFQSLDGTAGAPRLVLLEPTNNAAFGSKASVRLIASLFDPANAVDRLEFYAGGVKIGESVLPSCTFVWTNAPGGNYSITVRAAGVDGTQVSSIPILVRVDNGGGPRLSIDALQHSAVTVSGEDAFGRTYRIQFVEDPRSNNWRTLGTAKANASGVFQFVDAVGSSNRFYRVALQDPGQSVARPVLEPLRVINDTATLTWRSVAGQTYRVQYKNSMTDSNWHDLLSDITATGPITSVTNFITPSNQRFYRSVYP